MNISELARRIRINPQDLRQMLPEMGFDIGGKAIKVDDRTAFKILNNWRELYKKWQQEHQEIAGEPEEEKIKHEIKKEVYIPKFITVRDLAAKINAPLNSLIKVLMKNGVLASLNDTIDYESAAIVGDDLGWKVLLEKESVAIVSGSEEKIKEALGASKNLERRPPIVVVMGHVDHGKTSILDKIRKANVTAGEAGGITQHIGAYEIEVPQGEILKSPEAEGTQETPLRRLPPAEAKGDDLASPANRKITFIDTPGHEAFMAMRSRGAKVADIAILVVAADDGIKPQTREAIDIILAAKLPFIVAINKIDKPEADLEKIKRELAELNLLPEDWGGKIICVPVSAKSGEGINNLLDMILLVADLLREHIMADREGEMVGSVIESRINKGEGIVVTIILQNGALRLGDYLKVGQVLYGRARGMKNWRGENLAEALPGMPVKILGFKLAPEVGDVITCAKTVKGLEKDVKKMPSRRPYELAYDKKDEEEGGNEKIFLKIILKVDVLGSAEAILGTLEQFRHPGVGVKVIHYGLGNVTDADLERAISSGASIYGFNVALNPQTEEMSREKNVPVSIFKIIYELLDNIREKLEKMITPKLIRTDLGKLNVLAIFLSGGREQIVGGKIITGKIIENAKFDILRKNVKIDSGTLVELQSGKQKVKEAWEPNECGLKIKSESKIELSDLLVFYKEETREEEIKL